MTELLKQTMVKTLQFYRNKSGVAAVEFALLLPILLLLYLGVTEASRAITYDKRLVTATAAMGDLVARIDGNTTEAELDDFFEAARITIAPLPVANLSQVISSVFVDDDGDATIVWSRGYNGGTAHGAGDDFDIPDDLADVAKEGFVIVSEASMNYTPITNFIFPSSFTFEKIYYHLPRFGEEIELE